MSSKRKNTPTKLAASNIVTDIMMHKDHQRASYENSIPSDTDSHLHSDSDSECDMALHIVTEQHKSPCYSAQDDAYREGADSPGSDKPQSKKQRILQSVMRLDNSNHGNNESDNECSASSASSSCSPSPTDRELHLNNNLPLTTKPSSGGLTNNNHSVKKAPRGDSSSLDEAMLLRQLSGGDERQEEVALASIQAALGATGNTKDKHERLNAMIMHLQSLKDRLTSQVRHPTDLHLAN